MWEPLKELVGDHGDKLYTLLHDMRIHLSQIAQNTIAEVEYDEFTTRSGRETSLADETAIVELTPNEGFSWHITRVGITGKKEGNCAVYVGTIAPENLVDVFRDTGITSDRGRYFVPRGQALIFHFYEQGAGQICTANIQAEQLVPAGSVRRAARGTDNEAINVVRVPEVPSGDPLNEVQIGAR